MIEDITLTTDPRTASDEKYLIPVAARKLGLPQSRVKRVVITRRSIDARQRDVKINLALKVYVDQLPADVSLCVPEEYPALAQDVPQAVVVGAGPAGLFAALRLIQLGVRPVILERGKDVDARRKDMARIARENIVDPDSNYCFGEGGAGAFSDGKLYTRSKKRGSVEKILNIFCQHGASEDILRDAHPHIGTDRLPGVIKAMRHTIEHAGGEILFGTRVEKLIIDDGRVTGVADADSREYFGPVILATGHSARDVYRMLDASGVTLEPKGLAIGVRLEHPQHLIDCLRYHSRDGRGKYLPAAEYTMLTRVDGRAVYSFCMCPGGFIIPAASADGQLVVNGMSPSNRGTRWANSGMVVEILPEDVEGDSPLKMMDYQEKIERKFWEEAGKSQNSPAQRMDDFVHSRPSKSLPDTSYAPGIHTARMDQLLPPFVARRLQQGFKEFDRKNRGFLTNEAVLIGAETRTSSPVRIPRDEILLNHIHIPGLYPCGEGAGYAGGIVSAAMDGEKCADALAQALRNSSSSSI
ncbi:MAG: FAD-binding protein [Barnesiella sp.]|nr:FAD-binding protein [Barnesiella sp.]